MALRDSPFSDIKVPLAWTAGAAVVVCMVIAVALFIADRRETQTAEAYTKPKAVADAVQHPISGLFAMPVRLVQGGADYVGDYFFAVSENRKLKTENRKLRATYDQVVALQDINERYRALLGLKTDPPIDMISARAVTDSRGPFANARLINVGKEAGVVVGNPVMSEDGLVGRVTGVTSGAARVLILTDVSSRVPVMLDRTNARAILTGDGGPNPKLSFMRTREQPKPGDRVLTSGDGGVIPRGLPVGVAVKGLDGAWRVQLSADDTRIDFVRVLKFKDFSQLVNTEELATPIMPAQMGGALPIPVLPPPKPAAPGTTTTAAPAVNGKPAGVVNGVGEARAGAPSPPSQTTAPPVQATTPRPMASQASAPQTPASQATPPQTRAPSASSPRTPARPIPYARPPATAPAPTPVAPTAVAP